MHSFHGTTAKMESNFVSMFVFWSRPPNRRDIYPVIYKSVTKVHISEVATCGEEDILVAPYM